MITERDRDKQRDYSPTSHTSNWPVDVFWSSEASSSSVCPSSYVAVTGTVAFSLWWTLPCLLLAAERTVTVWGMGWRARMYAVTVVPEQIYTMLLTWAYLRALATFLRGRKGGWQAT